MNIMKKQNKVYSASDFCGATTSIVVADTWWKIDSVDCTAVGEFSKAPLFELQLKQLESGSKLTLPEGYEDASSMLQRNRTYYVREGRPLYNQLAALWTAAEDIEVIQQYISKEWDKKLLAGHVERLSGINYTRTSKNGSVISSSKLEVWYPEGFEEGIVMDDFVYLCNRGVYTPAVDTSDDDVMSVIKGLDPAIIKAIKAMK